MDMRPRTLGEIVDDAWRLALADAPLLLFFNALFLVPAFIALLLLLAQPVPAGSAQYLLPGLAAVLLPLTGLASGACQELFRQRAAAEPVAVRVCLNASLRRGLKHAAARAVVLCFTLPGPFLLIVSFLPDTSPIVRFVGFLFGSLLTFLVSSPLWGACISLHVVLSAGAGRSGSLLAELRSDVAASTGRAAVFVLTRLFLILFVAIQLHLLAKVFLWTADNLGGFDTTLLDVQLTLFENPIYTTALILASWLLLAPFFESGNYLLHTDIRTRREGLDLQYRVQRAFGTRSSEPRRLGSRNALHSLTVAAFLLLFGGMTRADEAQQKAIHAIRSEIDTIHAEIQKAEPYPGSQHWQGRLHGLQDKLTQIDGGDPQRFRWFEQAIVDFADSKKEDALRTLDDLQQRLSLLEESLAPPPQPSTQAKGKRSPEDIKSLLRDSEGRKVERNAPKPRIEEDRLEIRRKEEPENGRRHPIGQSDRPVHVGPSPIAGSDGLSFLGWLLLGGLVLAVVAAGIFFYLTSPRSPKAKRGEPATVATSWSEENDARQVLEQSPAALWEQAEMLAGDGNFRDAVRILYLAVLAHLHRQRLIRFDSARTNGEYVQQVRLAEQAPPELNGTFDQLTRLFETVWYGARPCEAGAYRTCRTLADEMQQVAARV